MKNLKNWQTTVPGIISLVIALVAAFGLIGPEEKQELTDYATEIILAISGIINILYGNTEKE